MNLEANGDQIRHFGLRIADTGKLFVSSSGTYRSDDNRENLICLIDQVAKQIWFNQLRFNQHFHPIKRLVAFFLDDPHLGDEVRA